MIVPQGWSKLLLHEVATIKTGIALGRRKLQDPVSLPYLRVANVQDGYLDLSEIKEVLVERRQIARYALAIGDVLLTEGGDADKLGRGDVWQGQIPHCLHQNHVFAVRPDQRRLLPGFLSALVASSYGRDYFLRAAKKSTNLASINSTQLKNFPLPLPPLAEQEVIVATIASWQRALAASEAVLQNSLLQLQEIRTQLIDERRYESRQWQPECLGNLVDIDALNLKRTHQGSFRYIELSDIKEGEISRELASYTVANAPSRARRRVRKDDILFSTVRPNLQGFARVGSEHDACVASTGFAVLSGKGGICMDFLYHCLFSNQVGQQIQSMVTGTNYPQVSAADLANLQIYLPSTAVQVEIAHALDLAQKRVRLERKMGQVLQAQKKELSERLLRGEFK